MTPRAQRPGAGPRRGRRQARRLARVGALVLAACTGLISAGVPSPRASRAGPRAMCTARSDRGFDKTWRPAEIELGK